MPVTCFLDEDVFQGNATSRLIQLLNKSVHDPRKIPVALRDKVVDGTDGSDNSM